MIDRVTSLLSRSGFITITLGIDPPTGRLIVEWPSTPSAPHHKYDYERLAPAFVRPDDSEFTYQLWAVLAAVGLPTPEPFETVHPYPLLHECTRDLIALDALTSPD